MRRRIAQDQDGVAAIEFALLAPSLILIILGVIELAYVASARSALEAATITGGRRIAASDCPATRQAELTQTITAGMGWVTSSDGKPPVIATKAYGGQFGDIGEPEPFTDDPANPNDKFDVGETFIDVNGNGKWDADMGKSGSVGAAGEIVSYSATFRVKSLVPFLAQQLVGQDFYTISASTVVRNEPIFRTTGCPAT